MNFISNDYSVRAPPVTIVPTAAGSTVLNLQPDPSLRTIGRSTASRTGNSQDSTVPAHTADSRQQAHVEAGNDAEDASPGLSRPRAAVDLYRSTQRNAGNDHAFHRIDLYA